MERWGRTQHAFQQQFASNTLAHKAIRSDADTRLNTIATLWTREPALHTTLFADKPADSSDIHGYLEQAVYGPYKMIASLTPWLQPTPATPISPELTLLWDDALPNDEVLALGYRALWPVAQQLGASTSTIAPLSSQMVLEPISVLDLDAPLQWLGSLGGMAARWAAEEIEKAGLVVLPGGKSFLSRFRSATQTEADQGQRLLAECWLLARLGPAYYILALQQGLLAKDADWLTTIEPALFHGLGYLNILEPQCILLHETLDRIRPGLNSLFKISDTTPPMGSDDHHLLWKTVEAQIPETQRFTDRHLERAQQLVPALLDNRLIAARPLYPMDAVREKLEGIYQADRGELTTSNRDDVYTVLNQTTELPATPREIITAGWLTTLHQLDDQLAEMFTTAAQPNTPAMTPLNLLSGYRQQQDYLLIKSLETTSVHQVLLSR